MNALFAIITVKAYFGESMTHTKMQSGDRSTHAIKQVIHNGAVPDIVLLCSYKVAQEMSAFPMPPLPGNRCRACVFIIALLLFDNYAEFLACIVAVVKFNDS